jgi:ABC-type phosphate/phosphonate transport system permease subunit
MNNMENSFEEQARLEKARKKIKEIKGFYTHLTVYLVVNVFFLIMKLANLDADEKFFEWSTFMTAICWGVGLFFHWYGIFGPNLILGKDWEEKKIKEMMEKKNETHKWE